MLPKNERRKIDHISKKTFWVYGQPYSGKTYLANTYDDVLMLNTDGNVKFVDAPYVAIKDEGRSKTAWEVFKSTVDELAIDTNGFKTIVVDLLEDVYQFARQYVLKREKITHESDAGYGKGYAMIDDEFLPVLKKMLAIDVDNIILISHEAQGVITKKTQDVVSTISPNIRDKIALKVSGMVDWTGRLVADDGVRTIQIKPSEFVFGGGRAGFVGQSISADRESIDALYVIDNEEVKNKPSEEVDSNVQNKTEKVNNEVKNEVQPVRQAFKPRV